MSDATERTRTQGRAVCVIPPKGRLPYVVFDAGASSVEYLIATVAATAMPSVALSRIGQRLQHGRAV